MYARITLTITFDSKALSRICAISTHLNLKLSEGAHIKQSHTVSARKMLLLHVVKPVWPPECFVVHALISCYKREQLSNHK